MDKSKIQKKCDATIELLSDCTVTEKYIILKNLSRSFIDVCKEKGIMIKELENKEAKE